jgi:NHL repeat.
VTRFPADDPGNAEQIEVGFVPRGVAIDSLGNAWIANALGHPKTREKLALVENMAKSKLKRLRSSGSHADDEAQEWIDLYDLVAKYPGGDVSMVGQDDKVLGPFDGGGSINGPWGIAVDGNDNVWVADAFGRSITHLCGARLENCPPGAPDRRPDLTTRRLHRRSANHHGRRHRSRRQRVGGEQLGSTGRRLQEESRSRRYPPASAATAQWCSSAWRSR